MAVKSTFTQAILQRCYEENLSLIEIHSHPFADQAVNFSDIDLTNETKKFRYVAAKIPHIYHATIVVGQEDVDAHVWDRRRKQVLPIDRIRMLETPVTDWLPNSSSASDEEEVEVAPWLGRQVLAFGEEGQRRLQDVRVGVIGCGGTGAALVQMLAHLGVPRLTLVDPDMVEPTNLNRLVGATRTDAQHSRLKVHVARRLVRRVNSAARVRAVPLSVEEPETIEALKGLDMLFGCTDNHGSRLILNQVAVQYLIPYLDLGAGLQVGPNGGLAAAGGQVRLVRPGKFCLSCIDGIDRARAAEDLMSPLARKRQAARGYIQHSNVPTPAVLFLNNLIASLAVGEFISLWTGYRPPAPLLYFGLIGPRLTPARGERCRFCIACGEGSSFALGDGVPLAFLEKDRFPTKVPELGQHKKVKYGKANSNQHGWLVA
jgi:molybdopterin/thiamine biosynthesis adenylyltransferase